MTVFSVCSVHHLLSTKIAAVMLYLSLELVVGDGSGCIFLSEPYPSPGTNIQLIFPGVKVIEGIVNHISLQQGQSPRKISSSKLACFKNCAIFDSKCSRPCPNCSWTFRKYYPSTICLGVRASAPELGLYPGSPVKTNVKELGSSKGSWSMV